MMSDDDTKASGLEISSSDARLMVCYCGWRHGTTLGALGTVQSHHVNTGLCTHVDQGKLSN